MSVLTFVPRKILGLLFQLFVSPFAVFLVVWLATGSRREGFLIALLVYSALSLFIWGWRLLGSATPGTWGIFLLTSLRGVLMLVSLCLYWAIYLLFWGKNFDLSKTSAIFN